MTIPFLNVRPRSIKLKVLPRYPGNLIGTTGVGVVKQSGNYSVKLDYSTLAPIFTATPNETTTFLALWQQTPNAYGRMSFADLKNELGSAGGFVPEAPTDGAVYGRRNSAWTPAVNRGGDTMTGSLTLSGGSSVFSNPANMNLFGTAGGTIATGAVTPADANVLFYNFGPTNWAGIGVDNNGAMWFKTGTSGTPAPGFYVDLNQVVHFLNPPLLPTAAPGDNTAQAANTNFVTSAIATRQPVDSDLTALAANVAVGSWTVTGVGTGACRVLTGPAAGITVTNGSGVAGNPTIGLANDLAALEGLISLGFPTRTGTDTWAQRTLQAPAAGLAISNPQGLAGDPTFALANDLAAVEGLATTGLVRRTAADTWSAGTALLNAELNPMNAFTFKGNNTSGVATPTDIDISLLTTKAAPTAADYVMLSDQAASGAWKKAAFPLGGGGGGGRVTLSAATTYYVRTDGSDANTGLVNNAGGAFLTIQKGIDTIASLDMSIYQATIQVGAGTYTGNLTLRNWLGLLRPIIQGDVATPSNVVINTVGIAVNSDAALGWTLQGFRITTTGGGGAGLRADNGGRIYFQNLDFGVTTEIHIWVSGTAQVQAIGNYSISGAPGGNGYHFLIGDGGYFNANVVVNIPVALAFAVFAGASRLGMARTPGMSFTGAGVAGCTGQRYSGSGNGVFYTGGSATFFPGSIAGAVSSGAQYL